MSYSIMYFYIVRLLSQSTRTDTPIPDATLFRTLTAVAEAPPPAFSGGGKWEAMHGGMAGFYEVRVQGGGMNHRLFCVLERDADYLGGSSIVVIDGLGKPKRSAADPKDYRRALRYQLGRASGRERGGKYV